MADDEKPLGGSLAALMSAADGLVDTWIEHVNKSGANTPELALLLLLNKEIEGNAQIDRVGVTTAMLATAIQRLAHERR